MTIENKETNGAAVEGDEPPPVPPDLRALAEMPFAGFEDVSPDDTRAVLAAAGVVVARDIENVGCTGLFRAGVPIERINKIRLAMGGGGVGLPCFVPPTRFCLAHNTIGGLMPNQKQHYGEAVVHISRPLTREEQGKVRLMEEAIHARGKNSQDKLENAQDILSGQTFPDGFEEVTPDVMDRLDRAAHRTVAERVGFTEVQPFAWKCPEHATTVWSCRYCAAQAVVEGELAPVYAIDKTVVTANPTLDLSAAVVEQRLDELIEQGFNSAAVYVRVARYTKKLSRD